ncbi:MAG: hypothetical protein NC548_55125 [Lachnospiraceae bacterium]|nr:hypothetical protein [Lachnospiraceae bacterium]
MKKKITDSFLKLKAYCEAEDYKGWDPYDGLNSRIFQALPLLNQSAICRLVIIQGFKRCPINLRTIALVPKEHNAKGIGLFLSGYCNLLDAVKQNPNLESIIGNPDELLSRINYLSDLLLSLKSKGNYHGACWGYNFDWQARRLFLFPKFTPTVVATNFCATALMQAYEATGRRNLLDEALTSANFVIEDLHRTPYKNGFIFSYSPLEGNDTVFNASLLGARLLSFCYKYTGRNEYAELARKSVEACCAGQGKDGEWVYGMLPVQSWIDSFHTGYNLDGLIAYQQNSLDKSFERHIENGFNYYIKNFFEEDGCPKYYNNRKFPIDIHCPGQLLITLCRLGRLSEHKILADKVVNWTIDNMQSPAGYFYYQLKPELSSKISYMRWSNAFMFNAFSHYLKNQ